MRTVRFVIWGALLAVMVAAPAMAAPESDLGPVNTVATGLDNPRGLAFGPDKLLYVAEGGVGGSDSTAGQCEQVVAPVGPYGGSETGARISRVRGDGTVETVVDGLPSSQTQPLPGPLVSGVGAVAFIGKTLYAVLAGAGCSHGVPDVPNGVIRVRKDGTWQMIADLSAFIQAHPAAHVNAGDFEPDGTFYSLVNVGGTLYTVEPNHGEVDVVKPRGNAGSKIQRLIDVSASEGHIVPTAIVWSDRAHAFYLSNLTGFPLEEGAAQVFRLTINGKLTPVASGLTGVTGLAIDRNGTLYALEMSAGGGPIPETGRVVAVGRGGQLTPIVTGLMFPTAITFDPTGEVLYISNFGFGGPPGAGEILSVRVLK